MPMIMLGNLSDWQKKIPRGARNLIGKPQKCNKERHQSIVVNKKPTSSTVR